LRAKLALISQKTKLAEAIRYALSRWARWVGPRQEFIETSVRMAVDDLRDGRSDEVARAFRDDVARYSDLISPGVRLRSIGLPQGVAKINV